jgi:ferredoxin
MSVLITESCIRCGACEWECPNEAISPGAARPVVDKDLCTECVGFFGESQCIVVCPVRAIRISDCESFPELERKFHRINPDMKSWNTSVWRRIGDYC